MTTTKFVKKEGEVEFYEVDVSTSPPEQFIDLDTNIQETVDQLYAADKKIIEENEEAINRIAGETEQKHDFKKRQQAKR